MATFVYQSLISTKKEESIIVSSARYNYFNADSNFSVEKSTDPASFPSSDNYPITIFDLPEFKNSKRINYEYAFQPFQCDEYVTPTPTIPTPQPS